MNMVGSSVAACFEKLAPSANPVVSVYRLVVDYLPWEGTIFYIQKWVVLPILIKNDIGDSKAQKEKSKLMIGGKQQLNYRKKFY